MTDQHNKPELSIVILCYKAVKLIIQFIEQIEMELKIGHINNYELVLVANYHDKRFDSTPEIINGLADINPRITTVALEKKGMLGWDDGHNRCEWGFYCINRWRWTNASKRYY